MNLELHDAVRPALAEEWDALADATGAPPWLRPGWTAAWWRAFGSRGRLAIHALRDGGRLAAVAPLIRRRGGLFSPTNWHTPAFGLAVDVVAREAVLDQLWATRPRELALGFLRAESWEPEALRERARRERYCVVERVLTRSPYVDLTRGWADYEASLARSLKKELRRCRRRLGEQGDLAFVVEDGRERLDDLLDEGFAVEAEGWKGRGRTAIASEPGTQRFYRDVARWAAARGSLRLGFLRLDGRVIAFEFNVLDGRRLYVLKGGYDERYGSWSPGMVVTYDMLEYAFASGLDQYDFLGTDDPFKLRWTSTVRERVLLHAFAPTAVGRVIWSSVRYGQPLARSAVASVARGGRTLDLAAAVRTRGARLLAAVRRGG